MLSAITYALAGMRAAETRSAVSAENIANVRTPGFEPTRAIQVSTGSGPQVHVERSPQFGGPTLTQVGAPPQDQIGFSSVRLEHELVDLKLSGMAYKAAAKVIHASNEMMDEALDLLI